MGKTITLSVYEDGITVNLFRDGLNIKSDHFKRDDLSKATETLRAYDGWYMFTPAIEVTGVDHAKGSDWTGIVETVTVDGVTEVVNDKVVKPKSSRRIWLAFWLLVVLGSAALVVFKILTGVTITGPAWAVLVYLIAFGAQSIGAYELWRRC